MIRRDAGLVLGAAAMLAVLLLFLVPGIANGRGAAPPGFCDARPTHHKCATPAPTQTTAPTPTPAPTPVATMAPTPTTAPTAGPCPASLQAALDAGGIVNLTGCTYSAGAIITHPVSVLGGTIHGSSPSGYVLLIRADNVTLDGVAIIGGRAGVWAESPANLVIRNGTITDAVYAGVMVLSATGGLIEDNHIARIGVGQPNGTNAYGIAISNYTGSTSSQDVTVRGNTVTDVPTWHGYDTHGGKRILFEGNIALRCSRAFFITSDSAGLRATDVIVRANLAGNPAPVTYNLVAITLYDTVGTTVTGNALSAGYPTGVYDYAGLSSGLVVSGNYVGETLP